MIITCTVCPNGCEIDTENQFEGASCPRGVTYAKEEMISPKRSLTTTVRTIFKEFPVLPVRTDGVIDKDSVFEAMKVINAVTVDKKLKRGDIVIENLLGQSVNVIATSDMTLAID